MTLTYQLLVLDPSEKTRCENAASLLHLIRGFTKLWRNPSVSEADLRITDGQTMVSVATVEENTEASATPTDDLGRGFILTMSGAYDDIESVREPLTAFLKDENFALIYVLKDQVSEYIACKLYPHLYRIENLLRGYLIRFMATHIGPRWWELTASAEMANKAKTRKKNERVFGRHIENSAYLIDFDELGEIVYEQSSGFRTREDILGRISDLAETPEAIRALKQELKSNYYKLFKESFAAKNFKEKWEQFETLRNKIAHNNLFTADDLETGERLSAEVTEIITAADAEAAKLVVTSEEREAIKGQVIERTSSFDHLFDFAADGSEISEAEFLAELDRQEGFYRQKRGTRGFVSRSNFVNHLVAQGYSYAASREMLWELIQKGTIEVYHVRNPYSEFQTAAIRRAFRHEDMPNV